MTVSNFHSCHAGPQHHSQLFRVENGSLRPTMRYAHTCPTCGTCVHSSKEAGRIQSKHKQPNGRACPQTEWQTSWGIRCSFLQHPVFVLLVLLLVAVVVVVAVGVGVVVVVVAVGVVVVVVGGGGGGVGVGVGVVVVVAVVVFCCCCCCCCWWWWCCCCCCYCCWWWRSAALLLLRLRLLLILLLLLLLLLFFPKLKTRPAGRTGKHSGPEGRNSAKIEPKNCLKFLLKP